MQKTTSYKKNLIKRIDRLWGKKKPGRIRKDANVNRQSNKV